MNKIGLILGINWVEKQDADGWGQWKSNYGWWTEGPKHGGGVDCATDGRTSWVVVKVLRWSLDQVTSSSLLLLLSRNLEEFLIYTNAKIMFY